MRWMERLPTLRDLALASEDTVLQLWQGLGYYSRARNLHRTAQSVMERFGGELPSDPALLSTLPGVGPYAAGAIAAFAFDLPVPTVDANIARVLARLANVQAPVDTPAGSRTLWSLASTLVPDQGGGRLHTSALMELGALVCLPKKPQCLVCPVRSDCRAQNPEALPRKAPRRATLLREESAAWISCEYGILLERQTGRRSKGLWTLPSLERVPTEPPLFETVYPFTHHRVTLRVHAAASPEMLSAEQRWFAPERILDEAAMPAGHRRAVVALLARTNQPCEADPPRSAPGGGGILPTE
jgi:A/G-specific adenine glycosylase